jgi:hypothetical protein
MFQELHETEIRLVKRMSCRVILPPKKRVGQGDSRVPARPVGFGDIAKRTPPL